MFAAIFWMSTAAFTVLWGSTGGEWWGFGVGALLALRVAMLTAVIGTLCYPEIRMQQRLLRKPQSVGMRFCDYALDFGFLVAIGWIVQHGAHFGMPVLLLYLTAMLLWELMTSILDYKR